MQSDELWRDDVKATSMAWVRSRAASEDVYTGRGQVEDTVCVALVGDVGPEENKTTLHSVA